MRRWRFGSPKRTRCASSCSVFSEALSLCGGAQFRTLILLNERDAAAKRSAALLEHVNRLSWTLPSDRLRRMAGPNADLGTALIADMSELRARFVSQPATARMLIRRDIDGRAFLERAEEERDEPFLVMPANTG